MSLNKAQDILSNRVGAFLDIQEAFGVYMQAERAHESALIRFQEAESAFPGVPAIAIDSQISLIKFRGAVSAWVDRRDSALRRLRLAVAERGKSESILIGLMPRGFWFKFMFDGDFYFVGWCLADGDKALTIHDQTEWESLTYRGLDDWSM